jgi:hypothetical protein
MADGLHVHIQSRPMKLLTIALNGMGRVGGWGELVRVI